MNGDPLTPAIIAGGAGATLMATVWAHERRQDEAMRKSFVRLAVRFPFAADPVRARVALGAISGGSSRNECVFEVTLTADGVRHYLLVPTAVRESVTSAFVGALPGLRFSEISQRKGEEAVAVRVAVRPGSLSSESPGATLPVLAALSLGASEQVTLRWAVRPGTPRAPRPTKGSDRVAKDAERAWREKTALPTFRVEGLLLARAAGRPRARGLAEHAASLIRSRRSSAGVLGLSVERRARNMGSLPRTTQRSGWLNTAELLPCLMLPLGDYLIPGVEVGATRALPVPRHVPREGLRLCVGRDSGGERPVAVSIEAARTHTCLLGGAGSGKSAALCWSALQLVAQGYGGVLIDPKADLVAELLDRVPAADADRVVVLDPAERGALPGLDLFGGGDPVLRSDVILSVLRGLSESWGPRIDRFLALGLRSAAVLPDPLLSDWLRLYSDSDLRREAIARLDDPIAIEEWRTYEALSPAEQTQFIAPAAARISGLLSRPALRAILNQPSPRLNIARLLEERKLLCVSLAPGVLGEPAAHLLGAILTYLTWSAVEARVAVPPHARRPVFLLMDELQSLSHLPVGLEVFFERTRGLGCGVVVATQGLARLPESARQSLLANVGSVLAFKAGSEEATRVARELPGLEASDIMGLGRYECAVRIATVDAGVGSAVITGRTEPLPPITGQASVIRAASAARYGRDPAEVEAEMRQRLTGAESTAGAVPVGRTGRSA
jgi:hypothetical protein